MPFVSQNDNGIRDDSGMNGFKPAAGTAAWGFTSESPGRIGEDEYLDDEEKERVETVIVQNEERKHQLFDKMQAEEDMKRQCKIKGKEALDKWNEQRNREIDQTRNTNIEKEKLYHENVDTQRKGPNPWERVVSNCDMNSASYVGGADVTRMRQAMIARKGDITKSNSKPLL